MIRNNHCLIYLILVLMSISCQNSTGTDVDDKEEQEKTYTFNFKVRIFDQYKYSNPLSFVWGPNKNDDSNFLKFRAPFDDRIFKISDKILDENYVYGSESDIWIGESFESTGIRVEWPYNKDTLQVDLSVKETDQFNSVKISKTVYANEFGNNFGINATVDRNSIEKAAFILDLPDQCTGKDCFDSKILESIKSIEMFHPHDDWLTFKTNDTCLDNLKSSRGSVHGHFYGLLFAENLPIDATIKFRINNKNGLSYVFDRTIGIVPFTSNIGMDSSPCNDWETYVNDIVIRRDELTNDYVNSTQLP